jgi:hypothetical protein
MTTVTGQGTNAGEIGVFGESAQFEGVRGIGHAAGHGAVVGINDNQSDNAGQGVFGLSARGEGVRGMSSGLHGAVVGTNDNQSDNAGQGVFGQSDKGEGVRGINNNPNHGAVVGTNEHPAGIGIFGKGGRLAGQFEGNVQITGTLDLQGENVGDRLQALEGSAQASAGLAARVATIENRMNTLQQQVNNIQQQLTALQTKEAEDVQGIAVSLATLAARVTGLGG